MPSGFSLGSLVPASLVVDSVARGDDLLVVTARNKAGTAACPVCGTVSQYVQSRYVRQPADLSCAGRSVRLRLLVWRFLCGIPGC